MSVELWHQIIMLMCLPHIDRITLHLNELLKRAYSVAYSASGLPSTSQQLESQNIFASEGFSQNAECHVTFCKRDVVPI